MDAVVTTVHVTDANGVAHTLLVAEVTDIQLAAVTSTTSSGNMSFPSGFGWGWQVYRRGMFFISVPRSPKNDAAILDLQFAKVEEAFLRRTSGAPPLQ